MDTSLSFHKHCNYVSERIDKTNNMLKVLAGSSWGQEKETLLMTYNALGKSIASYATPVWSTNASDSSFKKIQTAQNAALRTQIQNPFLTAQSTQIKSVISVPIKDFIHHYPRALFNDIPRVGAHFYNIPGSGCTFTTYPGRGAV